MSTSVAPRPGYHEHSGFFARATIGGGGYSSTGDTDSLIINDEGAPDLDAANGAIGFSLSLGGSVSKNIILHADLNKVAVADSEDDIMNPGLDLYSAGIGVTGYFMPTNVYVTGSVGGALSLMQNRRERIRQSRMGRHGQALRGQGVVDQRHLQLDRILRNHIPIVLIQPRSLGPSSPFPSNTQLAPTAPFCATAQRNSFASYFFPGRRKKSLDSEIAYLYSVHEFVGRSPDAFGCGRLPTRVSRLECCVAIYSK